MHELSTLLSIVFRNGLPLEFAINNFGLRKLGLRHRDLGVALVQVRVRDSMGPKAFGLDGASGIRFRYLHLTAIRKLIRLSHHFEVLRILHLVDGSLGRDGGIGVDVLASCGFVPNEALVHGGSDQVTGWNLQIFICRGLMTRVVGCIETHGGLVGPTVLQRSVDLAQILRQYLHVLSRSVLAISGVEAGGLDQRVMRYFLFLFHFLNFANQAFWNFEPRLAPPRFASVAHGLVPLRLDIGGLAGHLNISLEVLSSHSLVIGVSNLVRDG